VRRYLGYPRGRRPSAVVAARLDELRPLGVSLLRPRGALRLTPGAALAGSGMPRPVEEVAVGVCTIGPELEQESVRRGESDDPLGALILDAIGSAAAEASAEALAAHVCAAAAARGLRATRRISPGYGRWPVSAQTTLLALLPCRELGITLSPGLMMTPRKSVSFAARLRPGGEDRPAPSRPPCAACRQEPCPYRRTKAHQGDS